MQIRSRDLLRPQNLKKSEEKWHQFKTSVFFNFENKRYFVLVPSPLERLFLIQDRNFLFCQKVRAQK